MRSLLPSPRPQKVSPWLAAAMAAGRRRGSSCVNCCVAPNLTVTPAIRAVGLPSSATCCRRSASSLRGGVRLRESDRTSEGEERATEPRALA